MTREIECPTLAEQGPAVDALLQILEIGFRDAAAFEVFAPTVDKSDDPHDVGRCLRRRVRARPDRFEAFATLATPDPTAAPKELERAVTRVDKNGATLFGCPRPRSTSCVLPR